LMPSLLADSPFARFLALSDWVYQNTDLTHRLAPERLRHLLERWLGLAPTRDEDATSERNTEERAVISATQRQQRHQAALPSADVRHASISKRASSASADNGRVRARSKIISA